MDFWSRLIAGTTLTSETGRKAAANPEKRLASFKRVYGQLLQIWRQVANLSEDHDAAENISATIQELRTLLSDESRRPLPHPCIAFASSKQIYIPIGTISTTSYNEAIVREGVALFATLIDSEEEDFVENPIFSKSLMNLLVRITGANSIRLSSETEAEVVELAFNITTKIRLDPDILPAWFIARQQTVPDGDQRDAHAAFTGRTSKEEFPLFYLLIDYIHHDGRTGDFARTGLLYLIEAASSSGSLEQWIVESDLATLMATGLGALYSQLSRKLVIDHPAHKLPPVLAFSDYEHPITTPEIVSSESPEFQGHMDTFLSHLIFWQDVLNHCKSVEVKQTLLEHFQVIFLQQLLYPSLLESSDVDGGSAVAVLTYLRRILGALDHPDMIHLILHYLLALPDTEPVPNGSRASVSAARKRKSMDLATMMATQTETASTPALFNLVDLIQGSLRSQSEQTISVTLQLVSIILRRHHRYAVTTLLRTHQIFSDGPERPIGAHDKAVKFLLSLSEQMGFEDGFDESYENYIQDSLSTLECHACSVELIAPKAIGESSKPTHVQATIPGVPRHMCMHTIRPEDPMLTTLTEILSTFFTNSIEMNLSLTGTIVDLATCGFMRVDGWLLPDVKTCVVEDSDESGDEEKYDFLSHEDQIGLHDREHIVAMRRARRSPTWTHSQLPPLLQTLQTLVDQAATYEAKIPRFEDLLLQRREAFAAASAATETSTPFRPPNPPPRSSFDNSSRSISPPPRPSAFDSLAHLIFPEYSNTPSRSNSPRGRRDQDQQRNSSLTRGYGGSNSSPPAQFPTGLEAISTPSRGSSRAISPSPLRASQFSDTTQRTPNSQLVAFAAVNQSILARKVGVASTKGGVYLIPVPNLTKAATFERGDGETSERRGADDEYAPVENGPRDEKEQKLASVSHIVTNVIVLQEFIIELAALVQVRAGLFNEVRFV